MSTDSQTLDARQIGSNRSLTLDFYLSEMSVSDQHGGGLTLQRVLGDDLDRIALFAHLSRFATDHPASKRFEPRCLDMPIWVETNAVRKIMSGRITAWLLGRPALVEMHARQAASSICAFFPPSERPLRGLVCPQAATSLYAVEGLTKSRPIEYITWMMDDHLVRWRDGNWEYPPHIEDLLARHLRRARCVFVISPAMAEFFQERFGVESTVLFSPADIGGDPQWEVSHDGESARLGYFGAIGQWQLDALRLVAESLKSANASLDIYSADRSVPEPLRHPAVTARGRLRPADVVSTMRRYDAVVLPASFDPAMRHMSGLNIATKMSECLASGTVTLLIAPRYAAMVRFLDSSGGAVIVRDNIINAVVDAIAQLRNGSNRKAVLQSARNLVQSHLSTAAMRQVWLKGAARLNERMVS